MKLLVLTTESVSAADLRDAVSAGGDPAEAELMIVAPALHESALRFWVSDADAAIERAEAVRLETLEKLGEEGVSAASDTGEPDLLVAVEDALRTFPADRIVIFAHPDGEERYGEAVSVEEIRERFSLPVDRAEIRQRD